MKSDLAGFEPTHLPDKGQTFLKGYIQMPISSLFKGLQWYFFDWFGIIWVIFYYDLRTFEKYPVLKAALGTLTLSFEGQFLIRPR